MYDACNKVFRKCGLVIVIIALNLKIQVVYKVRIMTFFTCLPLVQFSVLEYASIISNPYWISSANSIASIIYGYVLVFDTNKRNAYFLSRKWASGGAVRKFNALWTTWLSNRICWTTKSDTYERQWYYCVYHKRFMRPNLNLSMSSDRSNSTGDNRVNIFYFDDAVPNGVWVSCGQNYENRADLTQKKWRYEWRRRTRRFPALIFSGPGKSHRSEHLDRTELVGGIWNIGVSPEKAFKIEKSFIFFRVCRAVKLAVGVVDRFQTVYRQGQPSRGHAVLSSIKISMRDNVDCRGFMNDRMTRGFIRVRLNRVIHKYPLNCPLCFRKSIVAMIVTRRVNDVFRLVSKISAILNRRYAVFGGVWLYFGGKGGKLCHDVCT